MLFRSILPDMPVVYVTGSEDARVAVAALKAGAADYVWKDVQGHFRELLGTAIRSALQRQRLKLEAEEAQRAIQFVRGQHSIALEGNAVRSLRYLDAEVRRIGFEAVQAYPDKIAKVGFEEIHDAIWRYLDPDRCASGILRGGEPLP